MAAGVAQSKGPDVSKTEALSECAILLALSGQGFNGDLAMQAWIVAEPYIPHPSSADAPANLVATEGSGGCALRGFTISHTLFYPYRKISYLIELGLYYTTV